MFNRYCIKVIKMTKDKTYYITLLIAVSCHRLQRLLIFFENSRLSRGEAYKTCYGCNFRNKLECLSLASLSSLL